MHIFLIPRIDKFIRFNSLQYLRVIASLSVVFFHIEQGINRKYWVLDKYNELFIWGQQGVSLFFCLSGFVIVYSSYVRPKKCLEFLYSRIVRIYPAYLVTFLIFIVSIIFLPYKTLNLTEMFNAIFL